MRLRFARKRFIIPVAVGLTCAVMVTRPAAAEPDLVPPSPVVLVDKMTGNNAVTDTSKAWDVGATDLGVLWDDGAGHVLAAYGDTFSTPLDGGAGVGNWRSNVLLRSSDRDLADGMSFDWALTGADGKASEIVGSKKEPGVEHTTIPTAGIEVNGRQYLAYMSVRQWGAPGQWWTNFAQLAYSDDLGATWTTDGAPRWDNTPTSDDGFQMMAFVKRDGFVYMFGTPNGRFGAASVARVDEAALLDKNAYRYWDGAAWQTHRSAAKPVMDAAVAELTVRFDAETRLWQAIYLNAHADLVFRVATSPTGPWGSEQLLASQAEYPGLYGGFIHPWSTSNEIYYAQSTWNQYNVALMRFSVDTTGTIVRPNLLADPSFERSGEFGVPGGWQLEGSGGIDTNQAWAKMGRRQVWLRSTSGEHRVVQPVTIEPGTRYRLAGWVRTGDTVGGGAGVGYIGVSGVGPGAAQLARAAFTEHPTWRRVSVEFDSHALQQIEVVLGSKVTADRWVQGDDFSLVAISEGSEPTPSPKPTSSSAGPSPSMSVGPRVTTEPTITMTASVTASRAEPGPGLPGTGG